jgi:hypothetical protein
VQKDPGTKQGEALDAWAKEREADAALAKAALATL